MLPATRKIILAFLFLFPALALAACGKNGPESSLSNGLSAPEMAESPKLFSQWKPGKQDEGYLVALKSAIVEDRVYDWDTLASAIIVRAMPFSPTVAQAAESMHGGSPYYLKEINSWGKNSAFKPGEPVVVLLGLYSPSLGEKDVTRLERFRPVLVTEDGRALAALEIKRYGRAATFVLDHFPIFNKWEEVFMVRFPAPAKSWQRGPLTFQLEWPGGTQHLTLKAE